MIESLKQIISYITNLIIKGVKDNLHSIKRYLKNVLIVMIALSLAISMYTISIYALSNKILLQYYILAIFFVFFIIILSREIRRWVDKYNGLMAFLSLLMTLGLFLINIERENTRQIDDRQRIDSKIASIINSDMGENLKIANDILEDKKNEWIFWWDFSINNYWSNWEYLQRQYNSNCIDEFQTAISNMEFANNIIYSQRRLSEIMTQDPSILLKIAKEQKGRIKYLKDKAVEIKNSLERISEANCS